MTIGGRASAGRALLAAWGVAAVAFSLSWWPVVTGDALIHLSHMEHAAGGRWFRFNPHAIDASATSPAWTVLGAALWSLGGVELTVLALKAIVYVALLLSGVLVFALARRLGTSRASAAVAGLLAVSLPGSVMNGLVLMENGVFALLLLLACWLLGRQLDEPSPPGTAAAFAVVGLSAALRPEGAVTGALLGAAFAAHLVSARRPRRALLVAVGASAALLVWAPFVAAYVSVTGELVPRSGVSRMMAARRQDLSLAVGPLWVYGRPLALLAAYMPIPLLAARGLVASRRRPGPAAPLASWLGLLAAAGVVLYALFTGAFHASRYLAWVLALCLPLAAVGWEAVRESGPRGRRLLAAAAAWLVVVVGADAAVRLTRHRRANHRLAEVTAAVGERDERTVALLEAVCGYGCCESGRTPAVALAEVQLRFFVDERLDVVSIDGTTAGPDGRPVRFDGRGCPDLDALAASEDVVALLQGFSGYGLEGCLDSDWSRAVATGWRAGGAAPPIAGWRWRTQPRRMLVRRCDGG